MSRGMRDSERRAEADSWIIVKLQGDLPPLKTPYHNSNDKPSASVFDGEGFHLLVGINSLKIEH